MDVEQVPMPVGGGAADPILKKVAQPLTEQRVAEVMEVAVGDRFVAAALLEISIDKLNEFIAGSPALVERWKETRLPTEDELVSGDEDNPLLSASEKQLAEAMRAENEKLRRGLESLGLTKAEQELAMSLQAFQRKQFRSSMEIIGAGVTRVSLKYQTELDAILQRLMGVRAVLSKFDSLKLDERKFWVEEERSLMQSYVAVGDQLRRIFEVSQRGAMTLALIRWRQSGGRAWQQTSKPGFRPQVIDADSGGAVEES